MKHYKYVIHGPPIPLARPRFGKNNVVYDSQKIQKQTVAFYIKLLHKNNEPLEGSLHMDIKFFIKNPRRNKKVWHDVKPDLSNLIKFYEDACIGILYNDDKQISEIIASKIYDENPRTEITLIQLGTK